MDTQRLILLVVFSFSVLMLWEAWQKEQRGPLPTASKQQAPTEGVVPAPSIPEGVPSPAAGSPTSVPGTGSVAAPVRADSGVPGASESNPRSRSRIKVVTELVAVEIDPLGGDIVRLELLKHKEANDVSKNLVLMAPEHRYTAQSGFTASQLPNHKTLYTAEHEEYRLAAGQSKVEVRLQATTPEGASATKTLVFHRDNYIIDIVHAALNATTSPIATKAYFHLTRDSKAPAEDQAMVMTFTGPAIYTDKTKYQKVSWSDVDKNKPDVPAGLWTEGWVAMVQHYFVSSLVPPETVKREFYVGKVDDYYRAGMILDVGSIEPGGRASAAMQLYVGPQEQDKLSALAPGLDLVVDYGWLTVFAAPLFWLLRVFHDGTNVLGFQFPGTGNWGWAIVLLTILVKLVFFPLSAASYRSMAKMKLVTPRLTKLREQYGDDRAKLNQAMMEMYKQEKINPLGGCLPIVVQIPVFIALYWVLLGSVELRQAPFMGWIRDLSSPDPWYVLPVFMLISMVIQTKMSPAPPDPVQAKVMMLMPFIFGVMFFWFPAGLVLYWFVNNVLSIGQQWQISRMFTEKKAQTPAKR
jgi:YidC/Oxa1 family membrane protein insertase